MKRLNLNRYVFAMILIVIQIFSLSMNVQVCEGQSYLNYTVPEDYVDIGDALIIGPSENNEKDRKVVFLTFDDGPSNANTAEIIDILHSHNVSASFFVVGDNIKKKPGILRALKNSGMDIYPHTYSHNYKKIYIDENMYMEDLTRCINTIQEVNGEEMHAFCRMPGGSNNGFCNRLMRDKIKECLRSNGINYIDWNVSSGDAADSMVPVRSIINNIYNSGSSYRIAVVLMHDIDMKKTTVEALPKIIEFYKKEGYQFKKLSEMTSDEKNYLISRNVLNKK